MPEPRARRGDQRRLDARQAIPSFRNRRIADEGSITRAPMKGKSMDMKSYAGKHFVKVDDVRDGPIEGEIVDIVEGEFGKLNLTLNTGDCLSLNKTNTSRLVRAFGDDSDNAIGQTVRLVLGQLKYQGRLQEAVLLEPSETAPAEEKSAAAFGNPTNKTNPSTDPSDEIPF
jgi:hypothetical protein